MSITIEASGQLEELRADLERHPLHTALRDAKGLRTFMEHHVICVLDFMSLLKRLQREVTCVQVPWVPAEDARLARFVNEIVADEESDPAFGEEPSSHYAWYVAAMEQVGADTGPIRAVEAALRAGAAPDQALCGSGLPDASERFARVTFELAGEAPHVVAATFFHGREDLLPAVFTSLARELRAGGLACDLLLRYLDRHVEVDGEDHGPLAARLLDRLCAGSASRQADAERAALRSLEARRDLWDAVYRAL